MTTVINIRQSNLQEYGYEDLAHWLENESHVYIGRKVRFVPASFQSIWANPFSAKRYGRAKCLELFKSYLQEQDDLMDNIWELDGKVLGCWCKPEACHGDILIEFLKYKAS